MQKTEEKVNSKRWIILLTTVLLTFMATLDGSIVNVALPVMANKLSVSMASVEWVVTSYLITIVAIILIFGRLSDIVGKGRIFKIGIVIFIIGSLMCGLSNSLVMLVVSRVIQAVGAASAMSTSHGIITQTFPPHERGKALGLNGTFVALGAMVGPPLGGVIVDALSWQDIFLINVPVGIIALILATKNLPKHSGVKKEKLDILGAVLFAAAVIMLFGAIIQGQEIGYETPWIIVSLIASIIIFIIFLAVEKRIESPLLDLEIFKNPLFSLSIFCGFISFLAISCVNIIMPFYLEYVLKLNPSSAGLFMVISPLILAIVAPLSGHVADKIGSESITFVGLVGTSLGLFLMSTLNENSYLGVLIIFIAIMTIGNGMFQSPNNKLIMSTVSKNKLGIAGSINALIRNVGMVMGISFATTLLYNRMSSKMGYHVSDFVEGRSDVFVYGMRWVYICAGIICAIGAVTTAYRLYGAKNRK